MPGVKRGGSEEMYKSCKLDVMSSSSADLTYSTVQDTVLHPESCREQISGPLSSLGAGGAQTSESEWGDGWQFRAETQ